MIYHKNIFFFYWIKAEWEAKGKKKRRMNRKMDRRNRWEKKHILCMPPPVNEWKDVERITSADGWVSSFSVGPLCTVFYCDAQLLSSSFLHCSFYCNLLISESSCMCVFGTDEWCSHSVKWLLSSTSFQSFIWW